jgi:glyceraldehyde-3-phosphate dehydrogenase (NADP+) (phosphorylating)
LLPHCSVFYLPFASFSLLSPAAATAAVVANFPSQENSVDINNNNNEQGGAMAAASLSIAIVPSCSSASVVKAASCSASSSCSSSCSQVAFSKGFSDFSGFKSTSCATFGRSSDDLALRVAAQTAVAANSGQKKAIVEAKIKVAINGFGRIGRNFIRCWHGRKDSPLEVVVINDTGGVKQASHLLKYDSMLGTFNADVKVDGNDGISVDGKIIKVVSDRNPLNLPWGELGIDLVIEGTGVFVDKEGAGKHLQAGAKKVLITAPGKGAIPTYVVGVNEELYSHGDEIISNASCTTNCLAPFVKVLDEKFGIIKGTMTTTHSYTGDQRLLDASHRDLRRARAAALNIVPTSTGAAKAVALVLPNLKGKLNGIALRVPTPNVSVVDLVVQVEKKTFAEEVNEAFRDASAGPMKGILAVCDEPLVSVDFRCSDVSSTIDSSLTMVMGDDMVKVVAWYDNEWGYSQRVVDLAHIVAEQWK